MLLKGVAYLRSGNFTEISCVCGGFSQMGSCPMCRIKMPFVSDDKFDAILPVAGTLAALIALLVILIV
ncbi:MAG TPA: hypothetical protein VGJ20_29420 [Xanthobacteraceae bacterium]